MSSSTKDGGKRSIYWDTKRGGRPKGSIKAAKRAEKWSKKEATNWAVNEYAKLKEEAQEKIKLSVKRVRVKKGALKELIVKAKEKCSPGTEQSMNAGRHDHMAENTTNGNVVSSEEFRSRYKEATRLLLELSLAKATAALDPKYVTWCVSKTELRPNMQPCLLFVRNPSRSTFTKQ